MFPAASSRCSRSTGSAARGRADLIGRSRRTRLGKQRRAARRTTCPWSRVKLSKPRQQLRSNRDTLGRARRDCPLPALPDGAHHARSRLAAGIALLLALQPPEAAAGHRRRAPRPPGRFLVATEAGARHCSSITRIVVLLGYAASRARWDSIVNRRYRHRATRRSWRARSRGLGQALLRSAGRWRPRSVMVPVRAAVRARSAQMRVAGDVFVSVGSRETLVERTADR